MSKMNAKIKEIGIHRRTGSTLQSLADRINPMLRGWLNYFTLYRKHDVRPILYNLENRLLGWARNRPAVARLSSALQTGSKDAMSKTRDCLPIGQQASPRPM
ncbi:MAG: hypothetical protein IPN95_29945 [Bacteroidetes bacterium]|nr:hypothetical protein [Bacteroidota bacterium]